MQDDADGCAVAGIGLVVGIGTPEEKVGRAFDGACDDLDGPAERRSRNGRGVLRDEIAAAPLGGSVEEVDFIAGRPEEFAVGATSGLGVRIGIGGSCGKDDLLEDLFPRRAALLSRGVQSFTAGLGSQQEGGHWYLKLGS